MMTVRLVHWEGTSVILLQKETLKTGDMALVSMSFQVSTPISCFRNMILCIIILYCALFIVRCKQECAYSGIHVSPAWRLDRKMRRRLILQET